MPKAKTDALKTKADFAKALAESFDYCDATFEKLDDQKILSSPQMVTSFLHTTVHNNEIYGNVVGYLRANHILPPSTEMMQEMRKGKKTAAEVMKEMLEEVQEIADVESLRVASDSPIPSVDPTHRSELGFQRFHSNLMGWRAFPNGRTRSSHPPGSSICCDADVGHPCRLVPSNR